jgi:hypothetical protein
MSDIRLVKTVTRSLPVHLTDLDLLRVGQELASTVQDIVVEEARQVDVKAQMKARMTELNARRERLAISVSRKEEHQDVDVDVFYDYQRGIAEMVRRDTGEAIERRRLSDEERQRPLPMVEATD